MRASLHIGASLLLTGWKKTIFFFQKKRRPSFFLEEEDVLLLEEEFLLLIEAKRFSQIQQSSKRFNVCAGSNRTDVPPRTSQKGSPPLKRYGSGKCFFDPHVR